MTNSRDISAAKQSTIYTYVCENPDSTVKEIAQSLGYSHDSTAHAIKSLLKEGRIEKGERFMDRSGRRPRIFRKVSE